MDTPGQASCKEVGEEEWGCFVEVPEGGVGDVVCSYQCIIFQVCDGQACFVYCDWSFVVAYVSHVGEEVGGEGYPRGRVDWGEECIP